MTQRSVRGRGALFVAAAAVLWGLWPLWVRLGPAGGQTAAVALLVAGVLGLPVASLMGRTAPPPARTSWSWLGLGFLSLLDAGNVWLYFRALAEGAVAPAVLSHYLAPVFVAVLAPLVLGEARSSRTPLGLVLALAGTATLVFSAGGQRPAATAAVHHALVLGGGSALCYAANVLVCKKLAPRFTDGELMAYHSLLAGGLLVAAAGLPRTPAEFWAPLAGGIVSTLIAGLFYYAGLRRMPAEQAVVLSYLEPLAALAIGWLVLGESVGWSSGAGAVLVLSAGLLIVTAP